MHLWTRKKYPEILPQLKHTQTWKRGVITARKISGKRENSGAWITKGSHVEDIYSL